MKFFSVGCCLLLILFCIPSQGQNNKPEARKHANEFLNIGVGARAAGMGNAQTAVVDDVTSGYWNPAGLSVNPDSRPELALQHAAYFANIANYNYAAVSLPIDSAGTRRFGATLIRLGIDDIPNTLQFRNPDGSFDVDKIQSFSVSDFAAIFSYSWQTKVPGLNLGANAKVIYRGAGRFANAWGIGLDAGLHYRRKGLRLGLVARDFTNTYTAWTFNTETFQEAFIATGQEIPANSVEIQRPSIRLGIGYDLKLARRVNLLMSLDTDFFFDGKRASAIIRSESINLDPHFGMELSYTDDRGRRIAFLRGGFYNLQYLEINENDAISEVFPTAGLGFVIKNFTIDYALANIGDFSTSLHSHIVSLKFHIN
jgi:hypothetical protein